MSSATRMPPRWTCAFMKPATSWCWKSRITEEASRKWKFTTPNPSVWWECANVLRCSEAKCACEENRGKAPKSACGFRGLKQVRFAECSKPIGMKILLTDDHAVVRQGLKLILADHFKRVTFGEARNAPEALSRITKDTWDVVVLDVTMPGRNGLEVLKEMKRLRPRIP